MKQKHGPDDESTLGGSGRTRGRDQEQDSSMRIATLAAEGQALAARGDTEDACLKLTQALTLADASGAAADADMALLLAELSRLHLVRSEYAAAEPLLERLLTIKLEHGSERPEVATVLASLAAVRMAMGASSAAEGLYRRALQIREKTLPPNHLATVATMEALSETCAARGHFSDALALSRRALTMRETTLGPTDLTVREARERISDLMLQAPDGSSATAFRSTPSSHPAQSSSLAPYATELVALQREMSYTPATPSRAGAAVRLETARRESRTKTLIGTTAIIAALAAIAVTSQLRKNGDQTFAEVPPQPVRMGASPVAPPTPNVSQDKTAVPSDVEQISAAFAAATAPAAPGGPSPVAPTESAPSAPRALQRAIVPGISLPEVDVEGRVGKRALTDSFPGGLASGLPRSAETRGEGEGAMPPRLIGNPPQPRYPERLRDLRVQGEVLVQFEVDDNGVPDMASIAVIRSPHALLTQSVRDALKQFRFEPAHSGGPSFKARSEKVKYGFTFSAPGK